MRRGRDWSREQYVDELFIDMVPPAQGYGLVAMTKILQCAIDESEFSPKGGGDGHLVFGSYVFRPEAVSGFDTSWKRALDRYGLSHFHMTDCMCLNPKDRNEFSGWSSEKRVKAARAFIKIIKSAAAFGFCLSINTSEYYGPPGDVLRKWNPMVGALYPFGLMTTFWHLCQIKQRYADLREAQFLYYVEDGYEDRKHGAQTPGDKALAMLQQDPQLSGEYSCFRASFEKKGTVRSNEAADIITWVWSTKGRRVLDDKVMPHRSLALELTESKRLKHFWFHIAGARMIWRTAELANSGWGRYLSSRPLK